MAQRGILPNDRCGTAAQQLRWTMIEIMRTNDLVLISAVEAILAGYGIGVFVADQFTSSVEGSLGFLPRRILVPEEDVAAARRVLEEAGFAAELRHG